MARSAGSGPWPALPDEPAWPGEAVTSGTWTGQSGSGLVGGGWSVVANGPWPALPDDQPLWTVPDAALDAAHLARLDREQAGD
ncbi:hypothetical protein [Micromonospora sp. NPDC005189]|uniref:hypothetical protein n=1 Tax=unclassified Micromonospora TaxID=2617518 RepID=UPI00339FA229